MTSNKTNQKMRTLTVGLVYGVYFTLGFAYFETFSFPAGEMLSSYLPVLLLLWLQGGLCAALYFRRKTGAVQVAAVLRIISLMLLFLLLTGSLLYLYTGLTTTDGFGLPLLRRLAGDHLLLCMLPLVVALVLWQQRTVKVATYQPQSAKEPLPDAESVPPPDTPSEKPSAILKVDAGGEGQTLEVKLSDLLFVEAADNYCKFYYLAEEKRKTKTLRMKIKSVEEALEGNADFPRIHRSYIVNRQMVEEIQGSSQAHKLKLMHCGELLPVSRSFEMDRLRGK